MPKYRRFALVAIVLALATGGCASPAAPASAPRDDRPLVLATFTVLRDLAQRVAGDELRVESVTKVGAEIHGYEPTPSDLTRAHGAQLILSNGLGLEGWLAQFVQDVDAPQVVLSKGIDPIDITVGEYKGRPNPHAWMSPVAAEVYVRNAAAAFATLLPGAADEFSANADALIAQLGELADELRSAVAALPESQRMLISCEGAFSYLARDAGLDEGYLWAVNQESQGTARQAAALIDTVRQRHVPAVFCESTVSDAVQQQVVADTGARFGGILYVDSLSDGPPVATFPDLLRYDIRAIVDGLGGSR